MATQTDDRTRSSDETQEPWHASRVVDVASRLDTDERGLSQADADKRLRQHGANSLQESEQTSLARLFLNQFRDPLIYILVVAAAATLFLQEYTDTGVIAVVLLLNAIIGFNQERMADQAVRALRQLFSPRAQVLRDRNYTGSQ